MESVYDENHMVQNKRHTIKSSLDVIGNTFRIDYSTMSFTEIVEFTNITNLNLSDSFLITFENGVLNYLFNLKSINLSNNLISQIEDDIFEMNVNLTNINLRNNYLESINKTAFAMLIYLETLDLSHNLITFLPEYCLYCPNLTNLYIDNNLIDNVRLTAFYQVSNLVKLRLNDNKITNLTSGVFYTSIKLQYLNLSNNKLDFIQESMLHRLFNLNTLNLRNNCITQVIENEMLLNKQNLHNLDLSENKIYGINLTSFQNCLNLKYLKLEISRTFRCKSLENLKSLIHFELVNRSLIPLNLLESSFWTYFFNMENITVIKLIILHINYIKIRNFSQLKHLEYLHIECIRPNNERSHFDFFRKFDLLPRLKKLVLKRLNYFTFYGYNFHPNYLTKNVEYIDFTGLKNRAINNFFNNFRYLQYLNLSFSEIESIYEHAFEFLVNLKHLNLEHSNLKSIRCELFSRTTKLQIINCSYCRIEAIEDFSFILLEHLELLDLRHNCFTDSNEYTFFGLNEKTKILL